MPRPTVSTATPEQIAEALLQRGAKKKLPPTTCPLCEKSFIPLRTWQRYCSSECRTKHYNTGVKEEWNKAMMALLEENKALRLHIEELKERLRGPQP